MKKMKDTRYMVTLAMMAAIVVLLANTPLGMIQLPVIKATTVHIPVIIGSILLGPGAGAILGGVFGLCSMVSNTQAPTLLSFAFSPFLSTTGLIGALIFVMGSIYLLFAQQYAEVKNVGMEAVFGLVMATVATSGVPEAVAAAILVTVITAGVLKSGVLRQNAAIAG